MVQDTKAIFDKDIYNLMINLIDKANKLIVILSPWLRDCDYLFDHLNDAIQRDVEVIIVTRHLNPKESAFENSKKILENLKNIGVDLKFDDRLHGKTILCDNKEIIISSANLVGKSLLSNHEIGIISSNNELINSTYNYIGRFFIDNSYLKEKLLFNNNTKKGFEKIREKFPKAYESWSSSEEERLIFLFKNGLKNSEIAKDLNRQPGAIRSRLIKLKLLPKNNYWFWKSKNK